MPQVEPTLTHNFIITPTQVEPTLTHNFIITPTMVNSIVSTVMFSIFVKRFSSEYPPRKSAIIISLSKCRPNYEYYNGLQISDEKCDIQ